MFFLGHIIIYVLHLLETDIHGKIKSHNKSYGKIKKWIVS